MAAVKVYLDTLGIWAALTVRSCQTLGWDAQLEHKASAHPEPGERSALATAGAGGLALPREAGEHRQHRAIPATTGQRSAPRPAGGLEAEGTGKMLCVWRHHQELLPPLEREA